MPPPCSDGSEKYTVRPPPPTVQSRGRPPDAPAPDVSKRLLLSLISSDKAEDCARSNNLDCGGERDAQNGRDLTVAFCVRGVISLGYSGHGVDGVPLMIELNSSWAHLRVTDIWSWIVLGIP